MGKIWWCFSSLIFWRKRECLERLGRMKNLLVSMFPFIHTGNADNPHLSSPTQQRLHKLCLLQKLGCQKPCWDQARLSSLVNKQVVTWCSSNTVLMVPLVPDSDWGNHGPGLLMSPPPHTGFRQRCLYSEDDVFVHDWENWWNRWIIKVSCQNTANHNKILPHLATTPEWL